MSENQKKVITVGAVALLILGGAGAWFWRPANNDNFPDGLLYLCSNPSGKHQFMMTVKQLGEYHEKHYGQAVKCPTCGAEAARADKCHYCGDVHLQTSNGACPKCGKMPPAT
jgi:hypothetical protein